MKMQRTTMWMWPVLGLLLLSTPVQAGKRPSLDRIKQLAAASETGKRPSLDRIKQLVAASETTVPGSKKIIVSAAKLRTLLAKEQVVRVTKRVCVVRANDDVSCAMVEDALRGLGAADQALLSLSLNDLNDVLGGNSATDTMAICGNAAMSGATHLIPVSGGPTASSTLGSGRMVNASITTRPSAMVGAGLRSTVAQNALGACRAAQSASIQSGLGASAPGDAGYQRAVDNAVAAMDGVVAACSDGGRSMISMPGQGSTSTPKNGDPKGPPKPAPPAATPPESTPPPPATTPPPPAAKAEPNALEVALGAVNVCIGMAGTLEDALGASANPAGAILGAIGTVAGAGGLIGNETADTIGNAADVLGGLLTVAQSVGGGTVAVGFDTVFPLAGAFSAGYAATRVINDATHGAIDRGAVDAFGSVSDAYFDATGTTLFRPAPEGGKPSCAEVQARWARFKASCSQPGNNWQTYDCMLFVARLNSCADPALVNPGPQGDYACRAGHSAAESAALACEERAKMRDMFAISGGGGDNRCRADLGGYRLDLEQQLRADMCQRMQTGPDGGADVCPEVRGGR
jgi:hypothetical protein